MRLRPPRILTLTSALGLAVVAACDARGAERAPAPDVVHYYDDVKPLLAVHCYKCHAREAAKGGLRLDVRDSVLTPRKSGKTAAVAGEATASEILRRVRSNDPDVRMPPKGPPLAEREVDRLSRWIEQGAKWPDRDDYWAFTPAAADAGVAPSPGGPAGAKNPIDNFVDDRLTAAGLTPAPPADVRTLMRRAYLDLLGVPPTPEEVDAFLSEAGSSPAAFENLIDRLLADPRYGERYGRHWLDLVRYGESDGFEDDKIRPAAWRYRDYVIRSFNADKPYDRFVSEQIAGDELHPADADAWVATGFARLGMWDGMSKDPARQRQDFLNDVTDATGTVFLGMTVGCARCHDHKFDPISQQDYYGLQAFFAGVQREPYDLGEGGCQGDPPHVVEARRAAQAAIDAAGPEHDQLLSDARRQVEWDHRCEVDPKGRLKITDEQVRREAERQKPGALAKLDKAIADAGKMLRLNGTRAEVAVETSRNAPPTHILLGGELSRPGPEVGPRFVGIMTPIGQATPTIAPPENGRTTGRRAALAKWLTSPDHPLVARVWANRIWQHHFGRGIVATPSDFGRQGRRPTHPELLDYLARELVTHGWSTKHLHRLIMTSAAYQRSSTAVPSSLAADPLNQLFWRQNRQRLEAEAIRDGMLAVGGRLSATRGGPGVYPPIPKDVNVELPNNDKELSWYAPATDEEGRRRTIYTFQRRSLTLPLVEVFDGPSMNQTCPARATTTVAPQALTLLNGEFARDAGRHLAERAIKETGADTSARIERAFRLALSRPPTAEERDAALAFLPRQAAARRAAGNANAEDAAFEDLCHVILNTNEFVYVD